MFYFIESCKRKISPEDIQLLYSNQSFKRAKIEYTTAMDVFTQQNKIIEFLQSRKKYYENLLVNMNNDIRSLSALLIKKIKEAQAHIE